MGKGIKRTISMSKIKKITASKKKRKEKGTRAELLGSNPHSKGEAFSRSNKELKETPKQTNNKTKTKIKQKIPLKDI
jgi:hypothetical protein